MKNILVLSALVLSNNIFAKVKVIYGEDNRVDVYEEKSSKLVELAKSTAAMVPSANLSPLNDYETLLQGSSLQNRGVCPEERFAKQPTVANCSGFLVGKNQLVTAGHCVQHESDCSGNVWVFDYKVDHAEQESVAVENSKIYKCKKIVSRSLDSQTQDDYALIELEEEVLDRKPLKLRQSGKPAVGDELVVIGHPSGLPTKIAGGAKVRSVNEVYLVSNLDTYGGNSGSAVFNAKTGLVEGILVRGEKDYVWDSEKGCRVSNVIGDDEGRGEDVTLISNIEELMTGDDPEPQDPPAWLQRILEWLRQRGDIPVY